MDINFFHWNAMSEAEKTQIFGRNQTDLAKFIEAVRPIIDDVRARGDAALAEYEAKFNGVDLSPERLKVTSAEIEEASAQVDANIRATLDICAENVRKHNQAALEAYSGFMSEVQPDVWTGERLTPLSSVGLYVPGAKNTFPSTVYMLGVPAKVAGVEHRAMITQAMPNGDVNSVTLYAAKISGIDTIYKISGAHGIAALALGTETIKPVGKILGPGGMYALAAKLLMPQYRMIDTGFPAGPSESIVLADGSADPYNTVLDVLNEAEHGSDSAGVLVTHDIALAEYVRDNLPEEINTLPEPQRQYCTDNMSMCSAIIVTESLEQSIEVTNLYAAEHVLVKTENAEEVAKSITHAGSVLIGEYTPNTLSNFSLGSNHSLPTGGAADTFSGVSLLAFMKAQQISHVKSRAGFDLVGEPAAHMSRIEGFPGHENAVTKRNV